MSPTTCVKERPPAIHVTLEKTVRDSGHMWVLGKVLPVHLARARLRQDLVVVESPVVQMSDDKVPHVCDGAHERLCRIELDRGFVRRLSCNSGSCYRRRKIRRKRSPETRVFHAKRVKYVLLRVIVKRNARNGFNQITGESHPHVRVNNLL